MLGRAPERRSKMRFILPRNDPARTVTQSNQPLTWPSIEALFPSLPHRGVGSTAVSVSKKQRSLSLNREPLASAIGVLPSQAVHLRVVEARKESAAPQTPRRTPRRPRASWSAVTESDAVTAFNWTCAGQQLRDAPRVREHLCPDRKDTRRTRLHSNLTSAGDGRTGRAWRRWVRGVITHRG